MIRPSPQSSFLLCGFVAAVWWMAGTAGADGARKTPFGEALPEPQDVPAASSNPPSAGPSVPGAPAAGSAGSPPADPAADLSPVPPRPDSHLLDESGMLSAEAGRALSSRLLSCRSRTGFGLYLAIHTYLADETADTRASRTHAAWLEKDGSAGIVVVHDRGTGRLSFAGTDDHRLPQAEALRALYKLADASGKRLPREASDSDRIIATMITLADGLESWQKNGRLPDPPPAAIQASASGNASGSAAPSRFAGPPPWPAPQDPLVDEASLFPDPAQAAALRARLLALREEHGVPVFVVTVTYPPTGLKMPFAERLALDWLPDHAGSVIVYDRSRPQTLFFAGPQQVDRWIPPSRLNALQNQAQAAGRAAGESPLLWVPVTVSEALSLYEREGVPRLRESQQLIPREQRRILPWILAICAVCAALIWLLARWQKMADRKRRTVFLFPGIYVAERLGAPRGGGVTAETAP